MQVSVKLNNRVTVTAEGEKHTDLFHQLVALQEVFNDGGCGKCKSENLSYRIRKTTDEKGKKEYLYYELTCLACYAKLTFGQSENGALFPVRYQREEGEYLKDANGKNVPKGNRGWVKFNKETNKEE